MKVLYAACDQAVPGATGGSVHVLEVTRGLAARGHEVHAVVRRATGAADREELAGGTFHRLSWTPPARFFRFRARPRIEALIDALRPDVVMERYYNFGGEGLLAAEARGLPSLLEVNSPAVDHPGSLKAALDAALVVRPLRRYRERLCRSATGLIAPIPQIVPASARARTAIVTWGANVELFSPARRSDDARRGLGVPPGAVAVLFSGSFRPWHGVHVFEAAARLLRERADIFFVLAGGPESGPAHGYRGRLLGRMAYERMPDVLAACDVGVAPYDTSRMPELRLGFFWSPLKLFEYMASGLPSVTIAAPPLDDIVRAEREGLHVRDGDPADVARAIARLADDPELRARLGSSARARVVERFSWQRHCEQLEGVLRRLVREGRA